MMKTWSGDTVRDELGLSRLSVGLTIILLRTYHYFTGLTDKRRKQHFLN